MNLTNADSVFINGKEVQQISIDGNIVYTAGYHIRLSADKSFIRPGETVTISVNCEDLPHTGIELYEVINMTRIYLDTLETDESGKATYEYEGYGRGEVGFVAVYDEKESNTVFVDDYNPIISRVTLSASSSNIPYGTPVTFTARLIDQHGQPFTHGRVDFNDGQTSIGYGQLNNDGVATLTVSNLRGGSHSIIAEAIMVYSSPVEVNVVKSNTILTIDVPALVYSDNFRVTGVLKNENNIPISGATVRLKWTVGSQENSTTEVTNSDGEVTFDRDAPTSITEYTFQMEYDGNLNYNASASSVVQRTVGKETTIINISSPSSPVTVTGGSSFDIVGVVTDNDGVPINQGTVRAYIDDSRIHSAYTTISSGNFTLTVPISTLSDGQHSIIVTYPGGTYYTDADVYLTVVKASFDGIDLESDKSILSAADNEYATLTAQLTLSDVPVSVSGETVTFEVRKESDDSLIETLTANTDSSGIATVSYLGKGVGDIYIKAECMFLTKTYSIEDCDNYSTTTKSASCDQNRVSNVEDFGLYDGSDYSASVIMQRTGGTFANWGLAVCNMITNNQSLPSTYSDYKIAGFAGRKGLLGHHQGSDYASNRTDGALSNNTEYLFEMIFQNGNLTGKITQISNNTVVFNQTIPVPRDFTNYHFCLFLYDSNTVSYRNVKIKRL